VTTFAPIFVPAAFREATSDAAWLQAMLDAERALALAESRLGIVPAEAAETIAASCRAELFDIEELAEQGRGPGNPVEPLVRALRERAGAEAADFVHWGATSQDILDTAAMLVARRARALTLDELDAVIAACARLADEHRGTVMTGRTLMQPAMPITFGLKAAGWLSGVAAARADLRDVELAAQLGGPVGVQSPKLVARFAERLELAAPALPWHGDRTRVARLGAALAIAAGACEKVALDVVLLAEAGEVAESSEGGRGGSSSMPHKRNPVGAIRARAAARHVRGAVSVLLEAMAGEHERAAGAWQSEWGALSTALAFAGGAAWSLHEALEGLTVHPHDVEGGVDQATVNELIDRALELK
jgi:3-carboxy-cis,cis-muconate cycloisomerase